MQISIIKEINSHEQRVAASPESVKLLLRLGADVLIEKGAGTLSGFVDESYQSAGAKIVNRSECLNAKVCLCVQMPSKEDIDKMNDKTILVGMLNPYENKKNFSDLIHNNITACCMELIPRISRAQSMDVLSSQANLSGYISVIDAAEQFGKVFPMMMTAAGRVDPAKFIMVEEEESQNAETSGGYAKEMSEEYKKKQSALIAKTISKQDIVICTALIPGKPAPVLVSEEMINTMASGSIVVDLAVEAGGNCPLSKLGEIIIHNNVKIIGYANVPGRVAKDASALYAKNIVNFLSLFINKDEKKIDIDWHDEIINAVVLTHNGELKLEEFK